jgi:hypothetical protein
MGRGNGLQTDDLLLEARPDRATFETTRFLGFIPMKERHETEAQMWLRWSGPVTPEMAKKLSKRSGLPSSKFIHPLLTENVIAGNYAFASKQEIVAMITRTEESWKAQGECLAPWNPLQRQHQAIRQLAREISPTSGESEVTLGLEEQLAEPLSPLNRDRDIHGANAAYYFSLAGIDYKVLSEMSAEKRERVEALVSEIARTDLAESPRRTQRFFAQIGLKGDTMTPELRNIFLTDADKSDHLLGWTKRNASWHEYNSGYDSRRHGVLSESLMLRKKAGEEAPLSWLTTPSPSLGGQTPGSLINEDVVKNWPEIIRAAETDPAN